MKNLVFIIVTILSMTTSEAQKVMTPELLWKLGRITPLGISIDGKTIVYKVSTPSVEENKSKSTYFTIPISGGLATEVTDYKTLLNDKINPLTENISCIMKR